MSVIDAIIAKKLCGGGGSVPKPLTYDYMPEGYPKKTTGTVTVMEEQEIAFELIRGVYMSAKINELEIVVGQTYIVNWDGTEYECVCSNFTNNARLLGNVSITGTGDDTGEPFICQYIINQATSQFGTLDTSASHTIGVKRIEETVTPMAEEFLPATSKNTTVFYI